MPSERKFITIIVTFYIARVNPLLLHCSTLPRLFIRYNNDVNILMNKIKIIFVSN